MTGADHFDELLVRVEFTVREAPEHLRLASSTTLVAGWSIELAAILLSRGDFAAAYDVIMLANKTMTDGAATIRRDVAENGTDRDRDVGRTLLARAHGYDAVLPDSPGHEVPAAIDANALTGEEMKALGLDPGAPLDGRADDDDGVLP